MKIVGQCAWSVFFSEFRSSKFSQRRHYQCCLDRKEACGPSSEIDFTVFGDWNAAPLSRRVLVPAAVSVFDLVVICIPFCRDENVMRVNTVSSLSGIRTSDDSDRLSLCIFPSSFLLPSHAILFIYSRVVLTIQSSVRWFFTARPLHRGRGSPAQCLRPEAAIGTRPCNTTSAPRP